MKGPTAGTLIYRLAMFAGLSISMMVMDSRYQSLETVRQVLMAGLYPYQMVVDGTRSVFVFIGEATTSRTELLQTAQALKLENDALKLQLLRSESLLVENQRLTDLLGSVDEKALVGDTFLARVIKVNANPYTQSFFINKGTVHQTFVGQVVLSAEGVVGQINHAGTISSQVLMITDTTHAIPVKIIRNGLRAVAEGNGPTGTLNIPFLPNNHDIEMGDILVTSGLGGTFPPDYPVATVTQLRRNNSQPFMDITVTPKSPLAQQQTVVLLRKPTLAPSATTAISE